MVGFTKYTVGIYYIPWKVIMSLYYVGSFLQSYVKEKHLTHSYMVLYLLVSRVFVHCIVLRDVILENYIIPHAIHESNSSSSLSI